MTLEAPIIIALIGLAVAAGIALAVAYTQWQVSIGWANAIRAYYPPMVNGSVACPGGSVVTPLNKSGLYTCGPCLVYVYPNKTLAISCPR